jgi:hypothetical protein
MLLTTSPWCQVPGIQPFLRRPPRRKTLRWVQVLEPMEIRTVLSAANLTAQILELAVPTSAEAATTNLRAMDATETHGGLSNSLKPEQAAKEHAVTDLNELDRGLNELDRGPGQASVTARQVSIDPPAVVMSLAVIGNGHDFNGHDFDGHDFDGHDFDGHDFDSHAALAHGRAAIHTVFAVVDFEPLTWSISFTVEGGRNIDHAIKAQNPTASGFIGERGFEVDIVAAFSFGRDARSNGRVANSSSDLVTQSRFVTASRSIGNEVLSDSHLETGRADVFARSSGLPRVVSETSAPSPTGVFSALSPSRLLMSDPTTLRDNDGDDSHHDRDNVVVDRITRERLLENLTLRRSSRLIDGPIGDSDGRIVRLLEVPTAQSVLPPLVPLTLPTWDSEFLVPAKPTKPGQPAKPDQPNQPDQNSTDKKKTTNGKVQDKKKRDSRNENKRSPTDEQQDTGTEAEGNSAAPTMSAAPQSRINPIQAFLAARHSGGDDTTTTTQAEPSHETPSRSWWESCMDPTAWLAGMLSLSSIAVVWQDNRKRNVADATPRG